ncbi:hypothetical protein [Amycolatopsis aidingensis]|uniref:hypothetical protein n=1 Tax=Amycolatopsis aidingensis TaxID=2842453 RepID=UPI001C0C910D|nr:hypothetical protein [Amycolatopsis aidingensis]
MDLRQRWQILDDLCVCAERFLDLQVWGFGSMLQTGHPRDLDVLIIYTNPDHVTDLYAARLWETTLPMLDVIAMTADEDRDYRFIESTGAQRLHPSAADSADSR